MSEFSNEHIPQIPAAIGNADEVISRFGHWPSFHDAEVIRLELARTGVPTLTLEVYAFARLSETDEKGYYKLANRCLVTFLCKGLVDLTLEGFNHQNVVSGLSFSHVQDGIELLIGPCHGLSGRIVCKEVEVSRLQPLD